MKILITALEKSLDSQVDPRFGRANYFVFYDTETDKYEIEQNPNIGIPHGAGIQSSQYVISRGVKTIITGNVGPNAWQVLSQAGIKVFSVQDITVREAVELFKANRLQETSSATAGMHAGYCGYSPGGAGYSPQYSPGPGYYSQAGFEGELEFLKMQREMIKQQLEWIRRRIKEIEEKKEL